MSGRWHIAVVSQAFPPAANPESLATAKLVHSMLEAGARVTVLTTDGYGAGHERLLARLQHRSLEVLRVNCPRGLARLPAHLACAVWSLSPVGPAYFVHAGLRLFRHSGMAAPDVVYARGLPSHGYFVGARLAREYGAPLVVHFSDPWPKRQWPAPYGNRPDLPERWEEAASGAVLRQAAAFTSPSHRLLRFMADRFPEVRSKPSRVLPHAVPPWDVVPGPPKAANDDRMELVHAGRVDDARDPRPFLAGLRQFLDARPRAMRLRMIGAGWSKLDGAVRALRLEDDVEQVQTMDYLDTLARLRRADALLLLEAAMPEGIFLPSKFADYCWARRPLLAVTPRIGEVADYLQRVNLEVVPSDGGTLRIAEALRRLYDQWRQNPGNAPNASGLCAEFEGSAISRKLFDLVFDITRN